MITFPELNDIRPFTCSFCRYTKKIVAIFLLQLIWPSSRPQLWRQPENRNIFLCNYLIVHTKKRTKCISCAGLMFHNLKVSYVLLFYFHLLQNQSMRGYAARGVSVGARWTGLNLQSACTMHIEFSLFFHDCMAFLLMTKLVSITLNQTYT